MGRYALRRLLHALPLLFGITFLSFVVIRLAPGDPVEAKAAMNPKMTAQAKEKLAEIYGLHKPLPVQYLEWTRRALVLDFGHSLSDGDRVIDKIGRAAPVTLAVNGLTLLIVLFLGVPLGVFCALHDGSRKEKAVSGLVLAGFAAPTFWLALLSMSYFGVTLKLFPVSGLYSLMHEYWPWWRRAADIAWHLTLPVAVSSVTSLAAVSRLAKAGMLQSLRQPYVRAARSRGLPERVVLYRHALANALLPLVTVVGLSVPGLLGGSVLFESIFSIPGMGRLFFDAVYARDYPVIMGMLVIGAVLTLLGNLLADIGYALADPRVRLK